MKEKIVEYRSIEALATTMTKNLCIDVIRRQKNFSLGEIELSYNNEYEAPSPLEKMVLNESEMIIHEIIGNMPESTRTLIQLHDLDGKSYEELAAQTGQNINTIRVNISRARKHIREEFNRYQNERRGN